MNRCDFSGRGRELTRFRVSGFCEIPRQTHLLQALALSESSSSSLLLSSLELSVTKLYEP